MGYNESTSAESGLYYGLIYSALEKDYKISSGLNCCFLIILKLASTGWCYCNVFNVLCTKSNIQSRNEVHVAWYLRNRLEREEFQVT